MPDIERVMSFLDMFEEGKEDKKLSTIKKTAISVIYTWCRICKTLIPVEEGIATRGALLFRLGSNAAMYISLGDGNVTETFTYAALIPGVDYGVGV